MDKLSEILQRVSINTEVFFTGSLCGSQSIGGERGGSLHMLESGVLTLLTNDQHKLILDEPTVIYLPGPTEHRIIGSESDDAQLVCATIGMDPLHQEQLINSLPNIIHLPIDSENPIGKTANWLFQEAFEDNEGRRLMLDKLSDIFLLQVLRHVMNTGLLQYGILSGLTHPQLSKVIRAVNSEPEKPWNLEVMAEMAAMSRSKFATFFRQTVGQTPNDFVTDVRIAVAQDLLKRDRPVNIVANEVGYEHGSALARVFRKKLGLTPKEWLQKLKD